jgi:hypothetical protein
VGKQVQISAKILVIALAAAAILSMAQQVHATTVYTAKEDGTAVGTFEMGEKVRIVASSASYPYFVTVKDPDGAIRHREYVTSSGYDKVLSEITDKPGLWTIELQSGGGSKPLAGTLAAPQQPSTMYLTTISNVVPEVPLGTITIVGALFAALGIAVFSKRGSRGTSF